jgi:hypothetical protein
MAVITKQIREDPNYLYRILAVGERTNEGKLNCPTLEYFQTEEQVHPDGLIRLSALLTFSARYGPPKNRTKFKPVEGSDGIFEFKEFQHRLLCFWDAGNVIICTNGVVKKGDRLSAETVDTSENWKDAYFSAKSRNILKHEPEHL